MFAGFDAMATYVKFDVRRGAAFCGADAALSGTPGNATAGIESTFPIAGSNRIIPIARRSKGKNNRAFASQFGLRDSTPGI
jgi:hypothetical protein